ncbi:MAG: hypothetical protein U0354_15385 [Candidatus Sericytochromatia bacterium]
MNIDNLVNLRNDIVRELIESREKAKHDEASRLFNAKKEGEQIGIAKGKLEGEQIGIFKAKKELVIKLLTKKFSTLPENIIKSIGETNNIDLFQKIIDDIFEINSIDEITDIFN